MEIRLSSPKYKEKMYSLWQSCFGDDRETIDMFFKNSFSYENAVICTDKRSRVVSDCFASEKLSLGEKEYFAYYIYAAATAEIYRKQGIMGSLLEFTSALAADRKPIICFWFRRRRTFLIITKNSAFIKLSMPKKPSLN